MAVKVYIDGQEGTTGLKILERFEGRNDIELLKIDGEKRKDPAERKRLINSADFVFLCLPDAAAREAVSFVENNHVRLLTLQRLIEPIPAGPTAFRSFLRSTGKKFVIQRGLPIPAAMPADLYPFVIRLLRPEFCLSFTLFSRMRRQDTAEPAKRLSPPMKATISRRSF